MSKMFGPFEGHSRVQLMQFKVVLLAAVDQHCVDNSGDALPRDQINGESLLKKALCSFENTLQFPIIIEKTLQLYTLSKALCVC